MYNKTQERQEIELYYTGIDIGSTSAKAVVLNDNNDVVYRSIMPTG